MFAFRHRVLFSRTAAIEVGMQNSGLSVALAIKNDQTAYLAEPYGFIAMSQRTSSSFIMRTLPILGQSNPTPPVSGQPGAVFSICITSQDHC